MKAVIFHETGTPAVLRLEELPLPEPGAGEVRLRMTSIGLNRADALFREGRYFDRPMFPSRIGFEGAGIIDAVGSGVTAYQRADRVGVIPSTFNASQRGCCVEYAVYPVSALVRTPDSIPDELAGSVWMQYLTTWGALISEANLKKGEHVVISAASSSVGLAAIQIAKLCQAIPIATTTSEEKCESLRQLGALHVINTKTEDYPEQVKAISGGMGAQVIFDAVAGASMREHIAAAARKGTILIHGLLDRSPMDIHAGVLMKKLLTIKGYTFYALLENPEALDSAIQGITEGLNQGLLCPVIAKQFTLDQFTEAFTYLESNQQIGKIVINP